MLRFKNTINLLLVLMPFCVNAPTLSAQKAVDLNPPKQGEKGFLDDRAAWEEIPSERKPFSSSYKTPDGRVIIQYSKLPLNYENGSGNLVPVNYTPAPSSTGLSAVEQPNPTAVANDGSIRIRLGNGVSIGFSRNAIFMGARLKNSAIEQKGNFAIMKDVYPGIDKTFEFRFNGVKYSYVINRSAALTAAPFVIVEEELDVPDGSLISPDHEYGQAGENGWQGPMKITTANGTELGTIRGALCYDADNNTILASYKVTGSSGKQKVQMIIPSSWMRTAHFPVTIDPLVTGPTATYTAGYIPSCITPASGSDSILVTIPAQVTVTALMVSGSYYANPFTTAIMSQGAMFFSTSCNTSTTFTVSAATGTTPGTAYLTAYDLKSPLLCCKPQSCTAQTFYLSLHVQRTGPGTGCNTTYIYHDPFGGYPFSAYVEGHTIEGYGALWSVTPNTICSDVCNLTGTVYVRYGVPPFTITHPWMSGSITAGAPAGCSSAAVAKPLPLTIPTCPWTCDTISVLAVPPPTVTDACGNVLTGTPTKYVHIKEVPEVIASPNPITICSGETFSSTLTPCLGTSVVSWSGNGTGGTGTSISETLTNNTTAVSATTYSISAVNNGCNSDTITLTVNTDPTPAAAFSATPQPVIIGNPIIFNDNSTVYGGAANGWIWDFGDGNIDFNQNIAHSYPIPGHYTVCLAMVTSDGCVDTACRTIEVIPAEIQLPNVITANGDGQNELLYFKYLEYFGDNTLKVFDRWGKAVYQKENYTNDWNASKLNDGTYYYILTLSTGKVYPGFVQVISN
ncbi:MAG: gliding motility-associated C-terminal domain-containing protein [Bacteroidia bacterium]